MTRLRLSIRRGKSDAETPAVTACLSDTDMRDDSPARRRRLRIASDAGKQSSWRVQEWKLSGETASVLVHDDSVHFTHELKMTQTNLEKKSILLIIKEENFHCFDFLWTGCRWHEGSHPLSWLHKGYFKESMTIYFSCLLGLMWTLQNALLPTALLLYISDLKIKCHPPHIPIPNCTLDSLLKHVLLMHEGSVF